MMFIRAQFFKMFKLVSASVLTTVSICFSSYVLLLSSSYQVPIDNSVRDIVIYRVPFNHDSKLVSVLWDFWFKLISRQRQATEAGTVGALAFLYTCSKALWNHFWRFRLREFFNNRSRPTGTEQARSGGVNGPGVSSGQMTERDLVDKCSSFIILRWDYYVPHWLPEYPSRIKLELSSAGTLWLKKDVILGCFTYPPSLGPCDHLPSELLY